MTHTCLAMMAKAPAEVVLRAIESARPYVQSVCLVVAPGDPLCSLNIPLRHRIIEQEWRGRGETRTATLRHAERDPRVEWVLVLDAHATLRGTMPDLDVDIDVDVYDIAIEEPRSRWRWMRPQLFRARRGFSWAGDVHAHAVIPSGCARKAWPQLVFTATAQPRGENRWGEYVRVLGAELEKDPTNARTAFYYAQSLKDAGRHAEAFDAFAARADMPGFDEETFWSVMWMAMLAGRVGKDCVPHYVRAHEMMPHRAEPLAGLEHHFRSTGRHDAAYAFGTLAGAKKYPTGARLFVSTRAYSDEALAEAGITI